MSISVTCGGCGKRLLAPDELVGRRVSCPHCGGAIDIPQPAHTPQDSPLDWSHPLDTPALPAEETAFDPYYKWLGIPPAEQPANHYRLLGLANFESDLDVIQAAADRQMAHVRTYQTGAHSALSQAVLNELAKARLTLLSAERKTAYDAELVSRKSPALDELPLEDANFDERAAEPAKGYQSSAAPVVAVRRKKRAFHPALLISAGLIAATVVVALALSSRDAPEQEIAAKPAAATQPEPEPEKTLPANQPAGVPAKQVAISPPTVESEPPRPAPRAPLCDFDNDELTCPVCGFVADVPRLHRVCPGRPITQTPRPPRPKAPAQPVEIEPEPTTEPDPKPEPKPAPPPITKPKPKPAAPPAAEETLADRTKKAFLAGDMERFEGLLKSAADADTEDIYPSFALGLYYALKADKPAAADKRFGECADRLRPKSKGDPSKDKELAAVQANVGLTKLQQRKYAEAISEWRKSTAHASAVPECSGNVGKLATICTVPTCALPKQVKTSAIKLASQLTAPRVGDNGWKYVGLPEALEFFPRLELEDRHCMFCGDKKVVDCPVRGCNGGRVTVTRESVVGRNTATGEKIFQSNDYQVPCNFCRGAGQLPCWGCVLTTRGGR